MTVEGVHVREVLVDSNVILDVVTEDPHWFDWSAGRLEALAEDHLFVINLIIYSQVSVGFDRIEDLEEALRPEFFRRENLPWEAGFLAGQCFLRYRRARGKKRSPLRPPGLDRGAARPAVARATRGRTTRRPGFGPRPAAYWRGHDVPVPLGDPGHRGRRLDEVRARDHGRRPPH